MTLRTDFPTTGIHVDDHRLIHRLLNESGYVVGLQPGTSAAATNVLALRAAIAGAIDTSGPYPMGKRLIIPPGQFYLNDRVEIREAWGLIVEGTGLASQFIWNGGQDEMFRLARCCQCEIRNLSLINPYIGIRILKDDQPGVVTATMNKFENILMQGASYGFAVGGGDGYKSGNNDFNLFVHCEIHHKINGWTLIGSQSYNNQMINCRAIGNTTTSQYGVRTGDGADWFNCGSFAWIGGGMYGNTIADFGLGRSYQPYLINFYNSEGSARMLDIRGAYANVEITNSRWSANGLHADGQVIVAVPWRIQLAIRTTSIGDGPNPSRPAALNVNPTSQDASGFIFENNAVFSSADEIFLAMAPRQGSGNIRIPSEAGTIINPIVI